MGYLPDPGSPQLLQAPTKDKDGQVRCDTPSGAGTMRASTDLRGSGAMCSFHRQGN